ncbi:MAG: hypothetical protein QG670_2296 [Thermoproteota archaeon]|nr:hypothetical protein [Thermoproteota archaeon]
MARDYSILRIRQVKTKLECELIDPISMQIVSIDRRRAKFTEIRKKILLTYGNLVNLAGSDQPRDEKEFSRKLGILSNETGKILIHILKNLGFNLKKERNLALALDDQTVKIPWELAYMLKDPRVQYRSRLCEKLSVGRLRVVKAEEWFDQPDRRRTNKALVVGTNYENTKRKIKPLYKSEDEAEKVAEILEKHGFNKTVLLTAEKATKKAVIDELRRGVDVFHFTGHGKMSRNSSQICLNDQDLSARTFKDETKNCPAPRLTFFNACESSIDNPKEIKSACVPYSWAFAMAGQGGRVFIGTLWTVCEPDAVLFARKFYQEFFGKRRTLAIAMNEARDETFVKEENTDYTWSAYMLYGIPTLTKWDILR